MLTSLLAAAEQFEYDSVTGNIVPELGKGEVFLFALIGFAITFAGILLLIFLVWLCGIIVKHLGTKKKEQEKVGDVSAPSAEEDIGEEVRVAIIAAIAAYYAGENSTNEFKVKRIRRL